MLVLKTEAIGVDYVIDKMQKHLDKKLIDVFTNWNSYHRAYKNPKKIEGREVIIPEVYTSSGEYFECFFDDSVAISSFFIVDDTRSFENGNSKFNFSIIFQSKLNEVFPDILHRADEETITKITTAIKSSIYRQYLSDIKTGITEVYREFGRSQVTFDDMSYFHVCRFDFTNVLYNSSDVCCNDC